MCVSEIELQCKFFFEWLSIAVYLTLKRNHSVPFNLLAQVLLMRGVERVTLRFNSLLWDDQAGGGASQARRGNDDTSAGDGRTNEKTEGREL